jgi:hypothetical protein
MHTVDLDSGTIHYAKLGPAADVAARTVVAVAATF